MIKIGEWRTVGEGYAYRRVQLDNDSRAGYKFQRGYVAIRYPDGSTDSALSVKVARARIRAFKQAGWFR